VGAVKVDIEKGSRNYTVKYALNDRHGVSKLLRDRHRIASRRFHAGDYAASDILIDLHSAIESAGLTERQAEAIAWVYGADVTHKRAAEIMNVSREAITQFVNNAYEFEITYEIVEGDASNGDNNDGALV
jgi:predicted DNA-binding protein (UPF0251 family)